MEKNYEPLHRLIKWIRCGWESVGVDGSVCEWVGMDKSGWEWMGVNGTGWKWMGQGGSVWDWVGARFSTTLSEICK